MNRRRDSEEEERGWVVVGRRRGQAQPRRGNARAAGWRLGTTFFFRNFPEHCRKEELWRSFGKVGIVEDVFIPTKRDKWGNQFGFVRISKGGSDQEMLSRLNNVWIGSFIIRAFLPRHVHPLRTDDEKAGDEGSGEPQRRSLSLEEERVFNDVLGETRRMTVLQPRRASTGERYADVLRSEDRKISPERVKEEVGEQALVFQSLHNETEWLLGAFTGLLKGSFSWREHGEELCSECEGSLKVVGLGDDLVLIRSESARSAEAVLDGYDEWAMAGTPTW